MKSRVTETSLQGLPVPSQLVSYLGLCTFTLNAARELELGALKSISVQRVDPIAKQ